jgi:hypothetical protein
MKKRERREKEYKEGEIRERGKIQKVQRGRE